MTVHPSLRSPRRHAVRGFSLIEMTIAVVLLLSLVGVGLYFAGPYKESADRAKCIGNHEQVQTAGRSWQNMNEKKTGDAIAPSDLVGTGKFLVSKPVCSGGGTTAIVSTVPDVGGLFYSCSLAAAKNHLPSDYSRW